MISIVDNFLGKEEFNHLQAFIMSTRMYWHYTDYVEYPHENKKTFQFFHVFYSDHVPHPPFQEQISPLINRIRPISICRIKANLITQTPNIVKNALHSDLENNFFQLNQWTTALFYVNTNDGYTAFEDGTKIESVANRFVTFPTDMKHYGTSCTDEKTRIVINFNYFSE